RPEQVQSLATVLGGRDRVAFIFEDSKQRIPDAAIVLDQQDLTTTPRTGLTIAGRIVEPGVIEALALDIDQAVGEAGSSNLRLKSHSYTPPAPTTRGSHGLAGKNIGRESPTRGKRKGARRPPAVDTKRSVSKPQPLRT